MKRALKDRIDGEAVRVRGQLLALRAMLDSLEGTLLDGHPVTATALIVADGAARLLVHASALDTYRQIAGRDLLAGHVAKE